MTQTDPTVGTGVPQQRRGPAFRRRDIAILAVLLAAVAVVAALLIHGAAKPKVLGATSVHTSRFAGLAIVPAKPAPPLALSSYLGAPVNIADYRGRAVLVTFLYTHCPDICPLIASRLHTALLEMPAAERREVQIVAVSVDPRGDTPATVAQFLASHEMTGRMQYLIGSASRLEHVWAAWGIDAQRDANPELVAHSALIYGITGHGRIATIYPSNFAPAQIVHDVPRLAAA